MKMIGTALAVVFCCMTVCGGSVDSVTVDSVWNSDSTWYDNNGIRQQCPARDCFISFFPQGIGTVSCSLMVSLDSGHSWSASPNVLTIFDGKQNASFPCGMKAHFKARMFGADRSNVVFKVIANPCPERQAYIDMKFGMLLHFNMSTFDRCCCSPCYSVTGEWGLANTDEKQFKPSRLDCGQWADVAKSAGCRYMILTSKHHDGFCLWPTKYSAHCVSSAACTTDVVREFVDSARSRGIKVGLYYSIRDITNGFDLSFIKGQLTELLSNYGAITCFLFDGWGWNTGYNRVPYDSVRNYVKSLQPRCLIIENNHEYTITHSEIIEYEMPIDGPPEIGNIRPAEGRQPIRADDLWFWHPNQNCSLKTPQKIVDELNTNNSRNASYLLNVAPDTTGLIPQCQADSMKIVGTLLGVPPGN